MVGMPQKFSLISQGVPLWIALISMTLPLGLMPPADFIKYFFIDRLPVDRLACGLKLFDYGLHQVPLDLLMLRYARFPFAEAAKIFVNSHYIIS